ncbi:MAG: glycosyltransferase family 4 protein [Bacteroidales bacterium]|nr:glycosyltransferase family 4 protein [Bacteroidales bacterium]
MPPLIIFYEASCPFLSYLVLQTYSRRHPAVHIVIDNHGDRYNSCRNRLSFLYTRYLYRWCVARRLAGIGERFYGVTPGRCDFLRDIYGIPENKIALLPMGADDIALDEALDGGWRKKIRERFGIAPDDFLVVTGGKIDRQKNIHLLAGAVSKSQVEKLKLLVFGTVSEELRPLFEQLNSEKVIMAGWVPSDEVYRYFCAADPVCFPGLHSVLWEQALACRVPCAFTRLEGFGHAYVPGTIPMEEGTAEYYRQLLEPLADGSRQYAGFKQAAAGSERDMFRYSRIARKVEEDVTGK